MVQRMLRRLGYDLHRHIPALSSDAQRSAILDNQGVNLVLDVGANAGQFGLSLRASGYAGRIVSFEPLESARRILVAASAGDERWEVADRAAIGHEEEEIDLHVSANSVSSSALEMLDTHLRSAPGSHYVGVERVALRRLDALAATYMRPDVLEPATAADLARRGTARLREIARQRAEAEAELLRRLQSFDARRRCWQ